MKTRLFCGTIVPLLLATALSLCSTTDVSAQGSLSPPGAPAPTMKTLAQIEARTPIGGLPFTISQPGSYYVTSNLTCTTCTGPGNVGIFISTNDVAIDLGGFTIAGVSVAGTFGIDGGSQTNISVRNGTIKNWGTGAHFSGGSNNRFEQLRVYNNSSGPGIIVGAASQVVGCISGGNAGGSGIATGANSLIQDCIVFQNSQEGVNAGGNSVVISCAASTNTQTGIFVGDGCVVKDCASSGNVLGGIRTGGRCLVSGCTAAGNTFGGISVGSDNLVVGNLCASNTATGPTGAGIFSTGVGNRIEGNAVNGNSRGIQLNGSGNLILRNSAHGNGTNYLFADTQTFGPTNNLFDATGLITNQNPWANFSY